MTKTLCRLSLAALLATSVAAGAMAAGNANKDSSQDVTNTQMGGQTATPATGPTLVVDRDGEATRLAHRAQDQEIAHRHRHADAGRHRVRVLP